MQIREAVIVDTLRTAIGKRKGALAGWHPTDLLGFAMRSLLERNDVDPALIDDVVGGCVSQAGEQGCNVTRNAWVAAGLPRARPGDERRPPVRFVAASDALRRARCDGRRLRPRHRVWRRVDDRAPMSSNARGGIGPFSPAFLEACNGVLGIQFWVAQVLADKFGVTREEMDEFSVESQRRAAENTDNGHFAGRSSRFRSATRTGTRPARSSRPTRASGGARRSKGSPRSSQHGSPTTSRRPTSRPATRRR